MKKHGFCIVETKLSQPISAFQRVFKILSLN